MRWPTKFPYTSINNINLDWIIKQVKAFAGQLAGKQDAPAAAGTSGQVLGLDADLNPVWVDQSGGGGGTSDYNALANKPQINSVTLSGNKTASDLGLATATAVSDLENDVTRAFSEIDALPADTAPLMDGTAAAGVSAKLSRADHVHPTDTSRAAQTTVDALPADTAPLMDGTAAAGVSAKLSRADHVHPTDTSRAAQTTVDALPADTAPLMDGTAAAGVSAKLSRADHVHPHDSLIVRENLLDNWFFVGGGTGTHGVFPVNQRGQASYSTANAFTIDRWKLISGYLTVTSGGIRLNGTITQTLPASIGQPVTASALLSDGTMITPAYNDSTKTFTLTGTGEVIVAVKLEVGSVQTLAHLEAGIFVLNEAPHFVEQLLQCQTNDPFYSMSGLTSPVGTIQDGGYYRLGKLVVLSVRILLTQSLSDNTVVLEGCPLPLASSYNFIVVSTNYPVFENNFLNGTGQIRVKGSLSSGLILMLYTSYIGQ